MIKFNFSDLNKQAKIGYNALFNVIFPYANCKEEISFTVPLCLNSENKIALTEKNFIFFDSVLSELNLHGWYSIVENKGRAFDDVKGDFFIVCITVSNKKIEPPKNLVIKTFDLSDIDTSKLLKRDGKAEKAKTAENKEKKAEEQKAAKDTNKKLEEKTAEIETLKKEVAKKNEQLSKKEKKEIDDFNDEALISIANCIEFLIKKHCPIPQEFDFKMFELELFQVISAHWDLKSLDK